MTEEKSRAVRNARRLLRLGICGYQRAIAGLLAVSLTVFAVMYGVMRHREAQYTAELGRLQSQLQYAERVKEQAIEQYGGLLLELRRHSMEKEQEPQQVQEAEEAAYQYIGECRITYYCCEQYPHICGNGDGLTATGIPAEPGIVAVDPNVIPLGSTVLIDGQEYRAEDTGGAITGMRVDICVQGHKEADDLGTHRADVWIVR